MKRFLALILCLTLAFSLIPAAAAEDIELIDVPEDELTAGPADEPDKTEPGPDAEIQADKIASGRCGDYVSWTLYNGGVLTLSGSGRATDDYYTDPPGFYSYRDKITSVEVLGGVTQLGAKLFYGLSQLVSVTLDEDVVSIGDHCFGGCEKLTTIRFKGKAPSFGADPFAGVAATAYYLPVDSYGWTSSVMQQYGGTISWVLDNKAGDQVVWSLNSSGVLSLSGSGETWDFYNSSPGFRYPDVVSQCSSLVVNEGITKLGGRAFADLWYITNVSLPSSLVTISDYTFFQNYELLSVTIPAGVKEIGYSAFANCSALQEIRFCGSAPSFADSAFKDVTATAYYPEGVSSWTSSVMQDYGGTITWQSYFAGYEVTVTDYTKGAADCSLTDGEVVDGERAFYLGNGKAVLVAVKNGGSYIVRPNRTVTIGKRTYHLFNVNVTGPTEIVLVFKGDVNLDGELKASDGTMLKRALLGTYTYSNPTLSNLVADVNGDGQVKASEGTMVARAVLGSYTIAW